MIGATTIEPGRERIDLRRPILDLTAVALLLGVAAVSFWATFSGPAYLPAAIGGGLLGIALAAVCAWRGLGILSTAGLTVAAYFLFGGALALPHTTILGIVPTLDTLIGLALGVVTSWKHLLTTVPPVAAADGHLLVPFLLLLVFGVLIASLALRLRRPEWALLPALALLVLVIALGVPQQTLPAVQALLFAAVAMAWPALRRIWSPQSAAVSVGASDATHSSGMRARRLIAGAAVLVVAGGAGVAVGTATAPQHPPHILRDVVIPPFNVHDYPSPLQSFRKYIRDAKEEVLFTVRGLPEGERIRIAAMDQFDGQVYNVTDGATGSGEFTPLRAGMAPDADGTPVTLQVEIGEYDGVWVPISGVVDEIVFAGDRAETLRRGAYYNPGTETAIAVPGLQSGDEYAVETTLPAQRSDEQLAGLDHGTTRMPPQENVPESLKTLAGEAVANASSPIERVRALETLFSEGGFFSHGLEGEVISRAGHTSERIAALIGGHQMVGDDEQYAVAMALLAREIGIPARVVMGWYPPEEAPDDGVFEATGDALHAWVEVEFERVGWVAFDPTPSEERIPNDQTTKPKADPKPQVLQPPPAPQEPVDLPPTLPDDREAEDEQENIPEIIGLILVIGGISLVVLLILASPFIVIGAWKAARRRARRSAERQADRISGGWDELTDRAVDYGASLAPGATRGEEAAQMGSLAGGATATALAERADAQVFGPGEPADADIEAFWRDVDETVGAFGREAGFWGRMKARLSIRSLTAGGAAARAVRSLKDAAGARTRREPGTIEGSSAAEHESESP